MRRVVSEARKAEDGRIAAKYPLVETSSASYSQRTEWNVRDTGGATIRDCWGKFGQLKCVVGISVPRALTAKCVSGLASS